jgi:hypothetical protein
VPILVAIAAFFKSIPALAQIGALLDKWMESWKAADVQKRKATKDAAVDNRIDAVLHPDLVRPLTTGQQPAPDGQAGLPGGGESGTGMVPGFPEDNK